MEAAIRVSISAVTAAVSMLVSAAISTSMTSVSPSVTSVMASMVSAESALWLCLLHRNVLRLRWHVQLGLLFRESLVGQALPVVVCGVGTWKREKI